MAAATKEKEEVLSVDDQFLKDYIARGGKIQEVESGKEVNQENVDDLLREVGSGQKTDVSGVKKLQARAERLKAADEERIAREKAKADQKAADEAEKQRLADEAKRLSQSQKFRKAAGNAATKVGDSVQPAIDKVSSLHTVGGIGLLLVVLLILLFVTVQVNAAGDTRLKQLWAMLNGNAHLQGRVTPTGVNGVPTESSIIAALTPAATNSTNTAIGSGVPLSPLDFQGFRTGDFLG